MEHARAVLSKRMPNPDAGIDQFYTPGRSRIFLPSGAYRIAVTKGLEYEVQRREVTLEAGKTAELEVKMSRWINLPERGWYGADGHLHIARPFKELDPALSKWMQAEDVHFANLLQWGQSKSFHNAVQYAFGPAGVHREGDFFLTSGQENPRSHFLGHVIILGGKAPINFPDLYLVYKPFFEEARRQGALSGYAHAGLTFGAQYALSMDLPDELLSFIEVLIANMGRYNVWYDVLNSGFRMAPIAGTDYSCGRAPVPGRERFYTQVEGPLSIEAWLEGIRRGRTFATNGPLVEFRIDDKGIGEELALKKAGSVRIQGCVRIDPSRDDVARMEVIENGEVVRSFPRKGGAAEVRCEFEHEIKEASWLALRASGTKVGEPGNAPSMAHSGAIYVTVKDAPGLAAHPRAKALARAWLARLEDLEARLAEDQAELIARMPGSDVDADRLRRNRSALLDRIRAARKYFADRAR